ncbi:pectin acetylesterase-family hydrolase [Polyangium sp. 6x1]|uniref:pectin acetylesterase-family hydrolase n=1 Tax=Polyangium sp. 6x1 TaxID=3042689 RepID=UPI002482D962|nr:pectin acetylesterase-family hydrolase [Polyangium sp. 6x1]MDI1450888.1 pectin acetylesterase-family hydrolase [Polyangium sp. 6x1]
MRTHSIPWLGFAALVTALCAGCGSDSQPLTTSGLVSGGSASSGAGGSGGAGGGGSGGAGPVCSPEGPFDGPAIKPIDAPPGEWSWIPVDGAKCRDGSPTGFGVRPQAGSDKLVIYLEGGGACFNGTTCGINPGSFGAVAFAGWSGTVGKGGIFDTGNDENPVKDWNMVYVPYCSGDIHAGSADNVDIPGALSPKDQDFVGYDNISLYLQRIIPTFPGLSKVLLTGISAGGFGAAYNYDRVAQAFCPTPVVLIDDSGPPMSDSYIAPCLQDRWRSLWNLKETLPADCADCTGADGGGIVHYVDYIGAKYPTGRLGLISSTHDSVITLFFGYGKSDCQNIDGVATAVSGDVYAQGLDELRQKHMNGSGNWATYYIDGTMHTHLLTGLYATSVNGKKLSAWVGDVVNDGPMEHIGP